MNRRLMLAAVLLAFTPLIPAVAQSPIVVVNVHAWDCPPCIQWHNTYKNAWISSREFRQVRYVEIDSPTIRQAYLPKYWPEFLLPVLQQTGGQGVPRYLIVKDGKIVSDQYGVDHWEHTLGDLRKVLASTTGTAPAQFAAAPGSFDGKWSVVHDCSAVGQVRG